MNPRLLVLLVLVTVFLDIISPAMPAVPTDYSSLDNLHTVSQSKIWPRGHMVVRKMKRVLCNQRPSACQQQLTPGGEVIQGAGAAGLADELTTTTRHPHTAQYIVDDLKKPTTSAPQSYLRSLCMTARGVFPHPLDCRKFVDCWDGRVREKYCPDDQMFSDFIGGFCDYQDYVDCGSRPILATS